MDYNQFTSYYRSPSFANQNNLPPTALINRHTPAFFAQLPMGQEHLQRIGRKQFTNNASNKSSIEADNILKSPERYPYENRIALDKRYERNLNTIDIEGASGGTLLSQAVRNKMKAREELIRRQQQTEVIKQELAIGANVANEEIKRRQIAYEQYVKDQQAKKQSQAKQTSYDIQQSKPIQKSIRYGERRLSEDNHEHEQEQAYYMKARRSQSQRENETKNRLYQSIDVPELKHVVHQQAKPNRRNQNRGYSQLSNNQYIIDANERRGEASIIDNRNVQEFSIQLPTDRKSLRQQNPTNLSSDGPIHLAARSIIKGE